MRDDELLDLIDRTPLEELTPEQCAAIRAAAETSPEVCRACLERIGLEGRLAAALGKPQVSVDDLLAGQRRAGLRARSPWLTFAVLGLVLAAIAAVRGRLAKDIAADGRRRRNGAAGSGRATGLGCSGSRCRHRRCAAYAPPPT